MHLSSRSFQPYDILSTKLAFARPAPTGHIALSDNTNPHLAWTDVPPTTRSFALLCFDPEVPTKGDDVNQEGRTVPLDLPRADFFHWVLADLPASLREITEGVQSGVVPHGKAPGLSPYGGVQGINDYTGWFAGDASMRGDYAGYDGPCPPWNDERVHAYSFVLYALSVPTLGLATGFSGHDVRKAMAGHILAEARIVGLYLLNPTVGKRLGGGLASLFG